MFTWLNKQGVQSDSGYIVQFTGRYTCEYREGSKRIEIAVEDGFFAGKPCINISKDAFAKWSPPRPFYETPREEQERLMKNLQDAIEFQGLAVVAY